MRAVAQPTNLTPPSTPRPTDAAPAPAPSYRQLTLAPFAGRDYRTLLGSELRARAKAGDGVRENEPTDAGVEAAQGAGEGLAAAFVAGGGDPQALDDATWHRLVTFAAGGARALAHLGGSRTDFKRLRQAWRLHRGGDASFAGEARDRAQRPAFAVLDNFAQRQLGFASPQARASVDALLACYAVRGEAGVVSCARLLPAKRALSFHVGPPGQRRRARLDGFDGVAPQALASQTAAERQANAPELLTAPRPATPPAVPLPTLVKTLAARLAGPVFDFPLPYAVEAALLSAASVPLQRKRAAEAMSAEAMPPAKRRRLATPEAVGESGHGQVDAGAREGSVDSERTLTSGPSEPGGEADSDAEGELPAARGQRLPWWHRWFGGTPKGA